MQTEKKQEDESEIKIPKRPISMFTQGDRQQNNTSNIMEAPKIGTDIDQIKKKKAQESDEAV